MSLNFADVPQSGGGWFKPADHKDAVALLIEVKAFDRQRPTPNGPKDSALVDVTVFNTQADIDAGAPSHLQPGCRIEQTILARDLASLVGSATIVKLEQVESKKAGQRPAWVYRPTTAEAKQGVIAYATKREAEIQAALDSAPDFD
jgi:hypothetical protein